MMVFSESGTYQMDWRRLNIAVILVGALINLVVAILSESTFVRVVFSCGVAINFFLVIWLIIEPRLFNEKQEGKTEEKQGR